MWINDAAHAGQWGNLAELKGQKIALVPLAEAVAGLHVVGDDDYAVAEALSG